MRAKCLIATLAVAVSLLGTTARSQQADQKAMTDKIANVLRESGQLTDYRVGVKYEDGVVWLVGTVTSKQQLQTAVRLTEQMYGVSQVIHDLKVVGAQPTGQPAPRKKGLLTSARRGRSATSKRPSQLSSMLTTLKQPTNRLTKWAPKQKLLNDKLSKLKQPTSQPVAKLPEPTPPSTHFASSMLEAKQAPSPPDWITKPTTTSSAPEAKKLPAEIQPARAAHAFDNRLPEGFAYNEQQPGYNMPAPMARRAAYPANNRLPAGFTYARQRTATNMPVPMGSMPAPLARPARRGPPMPLQQAALRQGGPRPANYMQAAPCMPPDPAAMGGAGMAAMPMAHVPGGGVRGASYDQSHMPGYAWPTYASYPNYAALTYPRQYSPTAWPYIGPFYPYPQVPLGWRKVALEWDDGWWFLDFNDTATH